MKKSIIYLLLISLTGLTACQKNSIEPDYTNAAVNTAPGLKSNATKNVALNLLLKSPNGESLPGVVVSVYDPANTNETAAIFKGVTDENGALYAMMSVPASLNKVIIDPAYLRVMHNAQASINNNMVNASLGGSENGYSGDVNP